MAALSRASISEASEASVSGGRDLLLAMEFRRGHLRRNLRSALRAAIQEGRLASGTRLPSSRRLAADLNASRGVVTDVYDQLTAEGYLATVSRQAPIASGAAGRPAGPPLTGCRGGRD